MKRTRATRLSSEQRHQQLQQQLDSNKRQLDYLSSLVMLIHKDLTKEIKNDRS